MIRFQNVSKHFSNTQVLTKLSLEVPEGASVALLGLSGSGKTTALKLACGLLAPDEGEVQIDGLPLCDSTLHEVRKKIGYVIQDGGLFPHLTAFGNMELVGREAGYSCTQIRERSEELADMTKIPRAALSRYPRELSGGQKQRVGLMRALFLAPPILLLDEPLGALDPITRRQLQIDLKDLFVSMRKTVLLVTHDLYEAGYLAEQIVLLKNGIVIQSGQLDDLIKRPADEFVRVFVSSQSHGGTVP